MTSWLRIAIELYLRDPQMRALGVEWVIDSATLAAIVEEWLDRNHPDERAPVESTHIGVTLLGVPVREPDDGAIGIALRPTG